ncbi:hypothetical protein Lnau_0698 [Legionella nautarum]|uniref:Uncharacterized protein n=1 Tax=Legionella nautarum TaxID=45070 RepID=A0A0W0WTS8_9GAMM|nr:hypothetical protein [Legionella nautarum]KTD35714.1 hypothetical protein Lnau_0698 [Legionella nautarum]
MKFKSLVLASCLGLFSSAYADHNHSYPQTNVPAGKSDLKKGATYPGPCAIEIVNNSYEGASVYGTFEDGVPLESFYIPGYDRIPHVIHLDHYDTRYGYRFCHRGMDIAIEDARHHFIFDNYITDGSSIEIRPYFNNQLKAEVKKK